MPATHETAVQRHNRMFRAEMEQAEARRSTAGKPADFWQTLARNFKPPADDEADPTPKALAMLLQPGDRVIDVGAGGGRIAIPLARHCRELVAVEPSPAMRKVLQGEITAHEVDNIRIVPATWEEADVDPAELVFAANVTYGIQDIEPFVRKLDQKALRHAALVVLKDPPQSPIAPFWKAVYGEDRLRLPCLDELLAVVRELGAEPEVSPLGSLPVRPLGPREEAIDLLRFRLLIGPGSEADRRLLAVLPELTVERDGQLYPTHATRNERFLIRWAPSRMR